MQFHQNCGRSCLNPRTNYYGTNNLPIIFLSAKLLHTNFNCDHSKRTNLSDESKVSEIVYNKICGMTKLIHTVPALAYSIIRIYKEKKLLKQLGHNHYCCIMSVLLVHMNVFVTFEENIILSSKTFKKQMSQTDKWKNSFQSLSVMFTTTLF